MEGILMSELSAKEHHWFRSANSNPPSGFYAFKDRFLKRFATPEGFDLQNIQLMCHGCDGSGWYLSDVRCNRCSGTGIYDMRQHWLRRYRLGDAIYHKPMDNADVYHLGNAYAYPIPHSIIEGRISHGEVSNAVARRAYYRLLLRHEPASFYWVIMDALKSKARWVRHRLVYRLIRVRNQMDLFKAIEDSDLPF